MSYNPARQGAATRPRRQRRLDPRGGAKHSDIVAKHGPVAATVTDMQRREPTTRGWRSVLFCGDDFEMIYEFICSKNATGSIRHPSEDRALRVMAGELFVAVGGEVTHLTYGLSYSIPKGTEYQLATSGTLDAEVLFCQGPEYEKGLEQLSELQSVNIETKMLLTDSSEIPRREKRSVEAARKHAEQVQEERRLRDVARRQGLSRVVDEQSLAASNGAEAVTTAVRRSPPKRMLPGQQVQGVNPRPVGAAGFDSEE